MRLGIIAAAAVFAGLAFSQSKTMTQGAHRMEIVLERLNGDDWRPVDPTLVLAHGDRVRFKFRTNFDGFLYVMNQSTSGKYEQLFPRAETGQQNSVTANQQYQVPATSTAFRIDGPAGYERVYWLVTPGRLTDAPPRFDVPPPDRPAKPPTLLPRCDDSVMQARGDCVDHSAGVKMIPRGEELPQNLAGAADSSQRDLLVMQQKETAVIASTAPLTGPVIYEFRLAHR